MPTFAIPKIKGLKRLKIKLKQFLTITSRSSSVGRAADL